MRRKYSKKQGPVRSKKVEKDGITFASNLEKYCYEKLKEAGLYEKYEGEKFQLIEGFRFDQQSFERQSNGKGDFIERGYGKKVLGISYTPDFTGQGYIIETKGRANETFPLRWKLFKKLQHESGDVRVLYKPQTKAEVDQTIALILKANE